MHPAICNSQRNINFKRNTAAIKCTATGTSDTLPEKVFIATKLIKPLPMPSAIEKLSGIISAVKIAGADSVKSFQSISTMLCAKEAETKSRAAAAA